MVYFKRKSVQIPAPKRQPVTRDTPVWVIEATLEYFLTYDEYLERMDFYNQRKFICELTGHSCLTFFEALERETREARQVVNNFPEQMKEPILRLVQFSTISRLDQLVDEVYNSVRREYFLGETVYRRLKDQKVKVTIREKAHFNDITLANGEVQRGHCRYRVEVDQDPRRVLDLDGSELARDRRLFNKMGLRTFIKHAAFRENWAGCPWVVREKYATQYRLRTEMPEKLRVLCELRSRTQSPSWSSRAADASQAVSGTFDVMDSSSMQAGSATPEPRRRRPHTQRATFSAFSGRPVEDLVNFVTVTSSAESRRAIELMPSPAKPENISGPLMAQLIEIWSFLNVYNELLILSPIPFDCLVDQLRNYEAKSPCALVDEVHSALLTLLVEENDDELAYPLPMQDEPPKKKRRGRKPLIPRPEDEDSRASSQDAEDGDEAERAEASNDIESPKADTTPRKHREKEPSIESNRAKDFLEAQRIDWLERIGKRSFAQGGWQALLICLLYSVRYMKIWEQTCGQILKVLAPPDRPANLTTAVKGYNELDFEARIQCLHILGRVCYGSPLVRQFMDKRCEDLTKVRKERAEYTRQSKALQDIIKGIKEEKATAADADEQEAGGNERSKNLGARLEKVTEKLRDVVQATEKANDQMSRFECYRIRLLGKDRFFNRYWWMEINGMPRSKPQGSSEHDTEKIDSNDDVQESEDEAASEKRTSHANFLMGRLWVQGPSKEDRERYLENPEFNQKLGDVHSRALAHARRFPSHSAEGSWADDRTKGAISPPCGSSGQENGKDTAAKVEQNSGSTSVPANVQTNVQAVAGDVTNLPVTPQPAYGASFPNAGMTGRFPTHMMPQPGLFSPGPIPVMLPVTPMQGHFVMSPHMPYAPHMVSYYPVQGGYVYGGQIPSVQHHPMPYNHFVQSDNRGDSIRSASVVTQQDGFALYQGPSTARSAPGSHRTKTANASRSAQGSNRTKTADAAHSAPGSHRTKTAENAARSAPSSHPTKAADGIGVVTQQDGFALYQGDNNTPARSSHSRAERQASRHAEPPAYPTKKPDTTQLAAPEISNGQGQQMDSEPVVKTETMEGRPVRVTAIPNKDQRPDEKVRIVEKETSIFTDKEATEELDFPERVERGKAGRERSGGLPVTTPKSAKMDIKLGLLNAESSEPVPEAVQTVKEASPTEEDTKVTALDLLRLSTNATEFWGSDEWLYYDREDQIRKLQTVLLRGGMRESKLADRLSKQSRWITNSIRARQEWQQDKDYVWENQLAFKEMGNLHCRRRIKRG